MDNVRAIAMISMVAYHTMWDLVFLYGMKAEWYHSNLAFLWQQSICWTFIFLSGFCSNLSKNPVKQGMVVSFWGIVVMAVTQIFLPGNGVLFGVLTLIGSGYFLIAFIRPLLDMIPAWIGLSCSATLFGVTYPIPQGYVGMFGLEIFKVPQWMYRNSLTAYLGFPPGDFASTDYFPIFPWIFLFLCGVFGYILWKQHRPLILERYNITIPVLSRLGRYALVVYLLHQPIIYGTLEFIYFVNKK